MAKKLIPTADQSKIQVEQARYDRGKKSIEGWISSWLKAESVTNPKRDKLIDLYEMIMLDLNLKSAARNRFSKVLGEAFLMIGKDNLPNKELVKYFQRKWFTKTTKMGLQAKLFGFSLVEIYDISPETKEITETKLIQRRNVLPEAKQVLLKLGDNEGVPFDNPEISDFFIFIDGEEELGLLLAIAPNVLMKKFAATAWSISLDKFGMPIMVMNTDRAMNEKNSIVEDLSNLGREGNMAISNNEKLNLHMPATGDSSQNYKAMIDWCNQEVSKMVAGQTMTADNGSSRAQGEVHERTAEEIQEEDMEFWQNTVNLEIIPRMIKLGYPAELAQYTFEYQKLYNKRLTDEAQQIKNTEDAKTVAFERALKLLDFYDIEASEMEALSGVKVKAKIVATTSKNVLNVKKKPNLDLHIGKVQNNYFDDLEAEFLAILLVLASSVYNDSSFEPSVYEPLATLTATALIKGFTVGIGYEIDAVLLQSLKDNINYFSAAKSYQQLVQMQALLFDANGNKRTFADFKTAVQNMNINFNANFLQTEYNLAVTTAQIVSKWSELTKDNPDALITYDAVGDGLTTDICNNLDGITRKASDKFWNKYTPPNHFNCRSTIKAGKKATKLPKNLPEVKEGFAFNPAKEGKVFGENSGYFTNDFKKVYQK